MVVGGGRESARGSGGERGGNVLAARRWLAKSFVCGVEPDVCYIVKNRQFLCSVIFKSGGVTAFHVFKLECESANGRSGNDQVDAVGSVLEVGHSPVLLLRWKKKSDGTEFARLLSPDGRAFFFLRNQGRRLKTELLW
jgi:hypothetical protein